MACSDFAGFGVVDIFPAEGVLFLVAFAGETDAGEAATGGEDDAAMFVVVGFAFVTTNKILRKNLVYFAAV